MVDQNSQFGGLLTELGAAQKTNADAKGLPWRLTHMLLGDAKGLDPIPDAKQTRLINRVYRAPINQLLVSPNNANVLIAELLLPSDVGGWWIRELGLEDEFGNLCAVANCAPNYKPALGQNSGREQVVRLHVVTGSTANIELKIDASVVLASRAYVDGLTQRARQVEAEAGVENSKIMTPLRVLQAIRSATANATQTLRGVLRIGTQTEVNTGTLDNVAVTPKTLAPYVASKTARASQAEAEALVENSKIMTPQNVLQALRGVAANATEALRGVLRIGSQAEVNTGTLDNVAVTPKTLAPYVASKTILASQAEAEAGTENSKIMTPMRTLQTIRSANANATEILRGTLRVSTQEETTAGILNDVAITPKKLLFGFESSLSSNNGFITFPKWSGGFTIQWTQQTISTNHTPIFSLPTSFSSGAKAGFATRATATRDSLNTLAVGVAFPSLSTIQLLRPVELTSTSNTTFWILAIGV